MYIPEDNDKAKKKSFFLQFTQVEMYINGLKVFKLFGLEMPLTNSSNSLSRCRNP